MESREVWVGVVGVGETQEKTGGIRRPKQLVEQEGRGVYTTSDG
jgi:hypothetical protein